MSDSQEKKRVVGRFAPSPTGPLHLGSLVAAVGSYCLARKAKGLWLLRMEDLDAPRVVPGAADGILRTLEGYGLEWDGEIVYQSRRTAAYEAAATRLREKGLLFDCACSRKESRRSRQANRRSRASAPPSSRVRTRTCRQSSGSTHRAVFW